MFTIDTNFLIAYLGGEAGVVLKIQEWRRHHIALFVSSITQCELLSYPKLTPIEEERILRFLQENFILIPFDGDYAKIAAGLRRKKSSLKLPDAAIASVALMRNTPLITRNLRDFKKIPNLRIVQI